MFDSIGWGEIAVVALAALFIFGPDRLPSLAKDAAQGLKKLRTALSGAREQLHENLGPEFDQLRDLDISQYHPKTFLRQQLLADDDERPVRTPTPRPSAPAPKPRSRDSAVPPPYDLDAT